ncbi:MAG: endo-1,4-beta-xylanase [Bacteroidales bacterium]|nr:endo-1,4-beta-xylanase [Bacteroidales bacterium]
MGKINLWKGLSVLIFIVAFYTTCTKDSDLNPTNNSSEIFILKDKASFNIGVAVKTNLLSDTAYANTLRKNFNQITAEYEMKMETIWQSSASYSFTKADELVDYALQNEIQVHGHALVWYKSFPVWFKNAKYDSAAFEEKVKEYITTVVTRYKGKVISWDVVNEIFDDYGGLRVDETVYATFHDPIAFYGRCFQYTRNADPQAKLFYNDYSVVISGPKRYAIKQMVERFNNEGYPIDGLGDQFHYKVSTDKMLMKSGMKDMAATGLLVHISELDIVVNVDKSDSYVFTSTEAQKQADTYQAVAEMFEELPQEQKFAITIWGITDKYTWLTGWWHPKEYPLLFDSNYQKKESYNGFLKGLN